MVKFILAALFLVHLSCGEAGASIRGVQIEKKILEFILSDEFFTLQRDRRCHDEKKYSVYLIDNFGQEIDIIPEINTSHGEMVQKLLLSGRDDINVIVLNTALSKGLAQVINALKNGACVDAVISSTPGSNYTYDQISSLFFNQEQLDRDNILEYKVKLEKLIRQIAISGFPSVAWLDQIDLNSIKLRNDALKYIFIEALGKVKVPVILPYGNIDTTHKDEIKNINLLSLANNAKVYSALDQNGMRIKGFPYSPLSSGDERSVYEIIECPHPEDPFKAVIDINSDGHPDYTIVRKHKIAYHDKHGNLLYAPPVLSTKEFKELSAKIDNNRYYRIEKEVVLTATQLSILKKNYPGRFQFSSTKPYIWLNSRRYGPFYNFEAQCWKRGKIMGTSVIPPNKVKEFLPPKDR